MNAMTRNVHLFVIDPQNDFCHPEGSLSVPGAKADMDRLAGMIDRLGDQLAGVHVSLDSHRKLDISHPLWWRDRRGRRPDPFTVITAEDVRTARWTTRDPDALARSRAYLEALEATGRYPHVIWPYHCLIGDEGHNLWPTLAEALHRWEETHSSPEFVHKGANPWTEHFSAVQAEVPDPGDPTTQRNLEILKTIEHAGVVLLAGEALSHCLANTARDIVRYLQGCHQIERGTKVPYDLGKLVLLTDASSPVPGFEDQADEVVRELRAAGVRLSTTRAFASAA